MSEAPEERGPEPRNRSAASDEPRTAPSLLEELKRRKVFRVALVYGATAFVVVQAADLVFRALAVPPWALTITVTLALLGFPIALVLAWAFEVTPEGVRRTEGRDTTRAGEMAEPSGAAHAWVGRRTLAVAVGLVLLGVGIGAGWFLGAEPGETSSDGGPAEASVAALPFANLSPEEDDRYFADGVHEEILTRLARVDALKVISRTSVMAYRDTDKNLREIGEELGVRYVLEGSVRRVGDRVRVSAQLIDAVSDGHVWAETYDRSVSDVLAIQSDVASRIAGALSSEITPDERRRIENRPTESEEAYDRYLRAASFGWRGESAERPDQDRFWRDAVDLLEEAVELDPDFALAWAELATWNIELYWFGHDRTDERRARADRASARAVELAPDLGEAHLARGLFHYHGYRDYQPALEAARRAARTLPGDEAVYSLIGWIQRRMGRYGEALHNFSRAYTLDPRNPQRAADAAQTAAAIPDSVGAARRWAERAIQLSPEFSGPYVLLAWLHVHETGNLEAAGAELDRLDAQRSRRAPEVVSIRYWLDLYRRDYAAALRRLDRVEGPVLDLQDDVIAVDHLRGLALRLADRTDEARIAFERSLPVMDVRDRAQPDYYGVLQNVAIVHAALGHREEARTAIDRALALLPLERDRFVGPSIVEREAVVHLLLGDHDRALDALERLEGHSYLIARSYAGSPHLLRLHPLWDPLRDDPRFRALVAVPPADVTVAIRD